MASLRQWWRRAAAVVKDRRSLLLARVRLRRSWHHRELEAAVIRATSHEERWMDYRSAVRVFRWARTSPAFVRPIMWALARRARRTRSWAVAVKALMVAHGILFRSGAAPPAARTGRVPFELADFRDRSSPPAKSLAFSAFVRAYFRFIDYRSLFAAQEDTDAGDEGSDVLAAHLDGITKLQFLLELLLQIRPYGDGTDAPLVLEAMDCALIEIFQVYSDICAGIARFLASVPAQATPRLREVTAAAGVKVLWRAAEQSAQLSSYFELCRGLGVVNARRLPAFERVQEEDVRVLERLLVDGGDDDDPSPNQRGHASGEVHAAKKTAWSSPPARTEAALTAPTTDWVAFDEDEGLAGAAGGHWNPFMAAPWGVGEAGSLIELS